MGDRVVPVRDTDFTIASIAALAGGSYRLFAEHSRAEDTANRLDSTDPTTIAAHEGLAPVRLTLRRRY